MTLNSDDLAAYYANSFGSERHRLGQIVNASVNEWALTKLLAIGRDVRLLDVGTGYGFLLKRLKEKFGLHAFGIELSRAETMFATNQLGLDVRNSTLSGSGFQPESFDIVSSFEVIEHVSDPVLFLREKASLVRPGGVIVVMTDNFGSAVASFLGPSFPKWIPHSHISHFTPSTLERALREAGLRLERKLSFTPWELTMRMAWARIAAPGNDAAAHFDLTETLKTEMRGSYRFFATRRSLNAFWARLTARTSLDGALMYAVARKL